MNKTNEYYQLNAKEFVDSTINLDMSNMYNFFEKYIPNNIKILDIGFGSGRDSLYFLNKGYDVYSLDSSSELCRLANNKGLKNIINKSILDVDYKEEFDGIWACASLLHLDNKSLLEAFHIISNSLKEDGIIYVSFKCGTFSGYINDRYYTYLTEEELLKYIPNNLKIIDVMITKDVRDDKETKWLNAIIKKI